MVPVYIDFKGGNMAFYRCCDIGDEFACEEILLNQFEYQRWLRVQPHPDDDVTAYCSALGARIDKTEHFVLRRIDAISTLLELKGLHKLFLQLWHLDMPRLMAIAQALGRVRKEHWPDIDAVLVKMLTPTRDRQHLPGPRRIVNVIRQLLVELEQAHVLEEKEVRAMFYDAGTGKTGLDIVLSDASAEVIRESIAETKRVHSCDDEAALVILATGGGVRIKLFQPKMSDAVYTLSGARVPDSIAVGLEKKYHDIDKAEQASTNAYAFPATMRDYIQARDGHCRFPGCMVPASHCDIDHIEEYDAGGRTTPNNAQCLCRHHHNLKTSKAVDCVSANGIAVDWIMADGTEVTTAAEGVMFGQSFAQRVEARTKRRDAKLKYRAS